MGIRINRFQMKKCEKYNCYMEAPQSIIVYKLKLGTIVYYMY